MIIAGLMAMAFMGFAGVDSGLKKAMKGKERKKAQVQQTTRQQTVLGALGSPNKATHADGRRY
jgi:hypothetical protein